MSGQAGVGRAGHGGGLGDPDRDVGRPGTDVGKVLRGDLPWLEGDGPAVFRIRIEVLETAAAVLVDVEPCPVTEGVAPRKKLPEVGDEALADCVRNAPGLTQELVELAGEAVAWRRAGTAAAALTN